MYEWKCGYGWGGQGQIKKDKKERLKKKKKRKCLSLADVSFPSVFQIKIVLVDYSLFCHSCPSILIRVSFDHCKGWEYKSSVLITYPPVPSSFLGLHFCRWYSVVKYSKKQALLVRPVTLERGWILFSMHAERGRSARRCVTLCQFARQCSVVCLPLLRLSGVRRLWSVMREWRHGAECSRTTLL